MTSLKASSATIPNHPILGGDSRPAEGSPSPRPGPRHPRRPSITKPVFSCVRRVLAGLARLLPDDQRVYLLRSLRLERPIHNLVPEVRLIIGAEPELSRLHAAVKEPWTIRWIQEWIRPGDVVFDVGANVGTYAIYAGRFHRGQVRVFAFEPASTNYAALCQNIALNRCGDCVTPLPVLLAAKSGWIPFRYRSLEAGHALHASGDRVPGKSDGYVDGRPVYEQPMFAWTLDDLCSQQVVPIPNHVKLDVDGAEIDVLRGASRVLCQDQLRSVLVELADSEDLRAPVLKFLEEAGFQRQEHYMHREAGRPSYGLFVR
ncbi:MAG: FkbM family methyltransferase [Gemmatales bacterium]|nr:FkbM family methyltransferase [Gemmatales bacterium]MDW8385632.1 FkbM family methyltransferase [Gemmatales bacterium]